MINNASTNNKNDSLRIGEFVRIRQRGKKGTFIAEFQHDSQHRRISLGTKRRAAAERKARELEVQLANGTYSQAPKPQDIDEAIQQFIENKKVDQRAAKTITKYEVELKTFAAFAERHHVTKLQQITPALHDSYRAERLSRLDPYTVYNHAILLKGFTKWCESRDLIAMDPLRKVRLSEPARPNKWSPGLDVVEKLLAATAAAAEVLTERMLATLAFTGMRSGELVNLRPGDIDLEGNWILIQTRTDWTTKTKVGRKIPIHRRLKPHLLAALKSSFGRPFLFCAPRSPKYPRGDHQHSKDKLLHRVQALAADHGLPVGHEHQGFVVHSLRHFFRTFCTNAGIPERAIDVWMGHVGTRSTGAQYYQLSDEESQSQMQRVPFDRASNSVSYPTKGVTHVA